MTIINAHVHMIEFQNISREHNDPLMPGGIPVYNNIELTLPLVLPKNLIKQMDDAGIDRSILFAVDAPIIYSSNNYVHALCTEFPDRLWGFASVNPSTEGATHILERAIGDLGLKGLKLHPPLQNFYPNDEKVFPLYEKALELDIPVVFHVGTTPFGNRCRLDQANPILIDDVACQFPTLRIMLTHLGTLWHNEAFMVVEKHPNVFIDTAAYLYEIPKILDGNLAKRLGANKIIFGTDYPSPYADEPHSMKAFVDCLKSLDLAPDTLDDIFSENIELLIHGRPETVPEVSTANLVDKVAYLLQSEGEA